MLLLGAWWLPLSIDICFHHSAQQQTRPTSLLQLNFGTDGRTDTLLFDGPCSAYYANCVNTSAGMYTHFLQCWRLTDGYLSCYFTCPKVREIVFNWNMLYITQKSSTRWVLYSDVNFAFVHDCIASV